MINNTQVTEELEHKNSTIDISILCICIDAGQNYKI